MKQLIGSDTGSYSFNAAGKTVTLTGIPAITLANFLVITDVTAGVMLYNFADPALGGSYAAGVLTLEASTAGLLNTDVLQVWVDLPVDQQVDTGLVQSLTNTQLRASAVSVSGTVAVSNQPSQPLTDNQLRATAVPVTVSNQLSQPLTDAQLRNSAVPVTVSNQLTGFATDASIQSLLDQLGGVIDEFKFIGNVISYPPTVDRSQNRVRGTVAVESGTVTTVTGLTNIDSYPGRNLMTDINFDAWSNSVGGRFA